MTTSVAPDVNVLVAAYRDDHAHHRVARSWLDGVLDSCAQGGGLKILPMVATGFVRVVTHRRVLMVPSAADQAVEFIASILRQPGATMPPLGQEWPSFSRLCADGDLHGNQIPDAWIAAAVRVAGDHLVTFDAGFRRLLKPSEFTLLRPGVQLRERRAKYKVHRPRREAA